MRWQAQDQEWRGVDHGGNDVIHGKGRPGRFVGFKHRVKPPSCIIVAVGKGKIFA